MTNQRTDRQPWPLRALLLLALGAVLGLVFHLLVDDGESHHSYIWTADPVRLSLATFVAVAGLLIAFTLERERWAWTVGFAVASGAILGLVFYWNGALDWNDSADPIWRFASGLLAVAIAAPLFQTMRDQGEPRLPYATVHAHAWTNVVLWFAAWAFVVISWLLVILLAQLFALIGIELLRETSQEEWFIAMMTGGALGAAVGLLRDRDRILGLLQQMVTVILSFLAPVLALGLVLFVLALPFTGLEPLWEQTKATTPILLCCVIGAIILANAVIGNSPEDEAKARPLRWSAMALAAVTLPLVIVAAVSTGLRIDQHGLTPARLWASVFVLIAAACALAYLAALIIYRKSWSDRVRSWNIRIAVGVCALALLLATPILSFGALSTRDQVARLEGGRISPAEFDWVALRFDFGPSGRNALERLRDSSPHAEVKSLAAVALQATSRDMLWDDHFERATNQAPRAPIELIVRPAGTAVPADLRELIVKYPAEGDGICTGRVDCLLYWRPDERHAIVVADGCSARIVGEEGQVRPGGHCRISPTVLARDEDGRWVVAWSARELFDARLSPRRPRRSDEHVSPARAAEMLKQERAAIDSGEVEVREVNRRQLFIGGNPISPLFE